MTSNQSPPTSVGRVARQVAAGDVEPGGLGVARWQQGALQDQRALVLAPVQPGVVDTDGGAGGQFHGESPVALPERLAALRTGELRQADDGVVGDHRDGERGLDRGRRRRRRGRTAGRAGAQGVRAGRVEGVAVHRAEATGAVLGRRSKGASETALAKATRRSSALPSARPGGVSSPASSPW